jgi:hypothetical protein
VGLSPPSDLISAERTLAQRKQQAAPHLVDQGDDVQGDDVEADLSTSGRGRSCVAALFGGDRIAACFA